MTERLLTLDESCSELPGWYDASTRGQGAPHGCPGGRRKGPMTMTPVARADEESRRRLDSLE